MPRESWDWTITRGAPSAAGTITSPSYSPASRSSPPSAPGLFPPRPEKLPRGKCGTVPTVRTADRPERHFADSFITVPLAVARVLTRWLPRCPLCHRRPSAAPPDAHAHEHRRRISHFNQQCYRRSIGWLLWEPDLKQCFEFLDSI